MSATSLVAKLTRWSPSSGRIAIPDEILLLHDEANASSQDRQGFRFEFVAGRLRAGTRRFGQFPRGTQEQRENLVASLPQVPPAEARAALERAAQLNGDSTAILEERMAVTATELRRLTHGRTAVRGYAPPVRRVPLVDRAG